MPPSRPRLTFPPRAHGRSACSSWTPAPRASTTRTLLALLLAGLDEPPRAARQLAAALITAFRTAPRVLAAPPGRLRSVAGIGQLPCRHHQDLGSPRDPPRPGIAARDTFNPVLDNYDRVIEYCRTLAGTSARSRKLHVLLPRRQEPPHRTTSATSTGPSTTHPLYPREICVRALDSRRLRSHHLPQPSQRIPRTLPAPISR